MADTTTLGGHFSVLINDGFTWARYEIEAASEAAAHGLARMLWAKRGERAAPDEVKPEAMPEGYAVCVGGHSVPPDREPPLPEEAALAEIVEPGNVDDGVAGPSEIEALPEQKSALAEPSQPATEPAPESTPDVGASQSEGGTDHPA